MIKLRILVKKFAALGYTCSSINLFLQALLMSPQTLFYFKRLSFLLVVKIFLVLGVILWGGIGLGPDEAQYWTWSQQLDWGYYSKPPGIAWQIWLGTQLVGQTELGVRFFALIWATGQAYLVFGLAIQAGLQPRSAFWSAILMALSPIGLIGALLAITDGGCLFFWTLASLIVAQALRREEAPSPLLVGLCLLGGALFKWPVYFFWFFFLIARWRWFPQQSFIRVLAGVAISLFGLLPSVWWNMTHEWATFRHVSSTLQGGHGSHGGNFFEFIGSQALLLSPVLFVLMLKSWISCMRRPRFLQPALFFCGGLTLICLTGASVASLFQKVQGNWISFAYPTGLVWLAWYANEWRPHLSKWLGIGTCVSVILTSCLLILPWLYTADQWRPSLLSHRTNPFKHNMGWDRLDEALQRVDYNPEADFLISDKYQTTSILSFYGPKQKRAYFLNLQGARHNQFSYWPSMVDEQQGKTGYFIWTENQPHLEREWKDKLDFYQKELGHYFEKVEFLGLAPLLYNQQRAVKGAFIFRCSACKTGALPTTTLY